MKEYFEFTDVELTEDMMKRLSDQSEDPLSDQSEDPLSDPRFYGPDYDEDVVEERYD